MTKLTLKSAVFLIVTVMISYTAMITLKVDHVVNYCLLQGKKFTDEELQEKLVEFVYVEEYSNVWPEYNFFRKYASEFTPLDLPTLAQNGRYIKFGLNGGYSGKLVVADVCVGLTHQEENNANFYAEYGIIEHSISTDRCGQEVNYVSISDDNSNQFDISLLRRDLNERGVLCQQTQ